MSASAGAPPIATPTPPAVDAVKTAGGSVTKEPTVKQRTKYNKCLVKMMEGMSKRNESVKEQLTSILLITQMMFKSDPGSDLPWKESAAMLLGLEPAIAKQDFGAVTSGKDSMPKVMQPLLSSYSTFSDGCKSFMWKKLAKLCKIIRGVPSGKDASKKKTASEHSLKADGGVKATAAAASAPAGLSSLAGVPLLHSRIAPIMRPIVRDPQFQNIKEAMGMLQRGVRSGTLKLPEGGFDPSKMSLSEKDITDPKELEMFQKLGLGAFLSGSNKDGATGGGGGGSASSLMGGQGLIGTFMSMATELCSLKPEDREKATATAGPGGSSGDDLLPQVRHIKDDLEKITLIKHFHAVLTSIMIEITQKRGKRYPILIHWFYKLRWFVLSGGYVPRDETELDQEKIKVGAEKHEPLVVLRETVALFKRHEKAFREHDPAPFFRPAADEPFFAAIKMAAIWESFNKDSQKLFWQWSDHVRSIAMAANLTSDETLKGFERMAKDMLPEIFNKYAEIGALGSGGLQELLQNPGRIADFMKDFTGILKKNGRLFDVKDLVLGLTKKDGMEKACDLFFEFTNSAEAAAAEDAAPPPSDATETHAILQKSDRRAQDVKVPHPPS